MTTGVLYETALCAAFWVALAGYRPRVTVTASGGEQSISSTTKTNSSISPNLPATYSTLSGYNSPVSAGATISQTIFYGF